MEQLSVVDTVRRRASQIESLLRELAPHCGLTDLNARTRRDSMWDDDDGYVQPIVIGLDPYGWNPLPPPAKHLQQRLLKAFDHLREIVRCLMAGQPGSTLSRFENATIGVSRLIKQERVACESVAEELASATRALEEITSLVAELYDPVSGTTIYVPDTNALLFNPDLERWSFPGVGALRFVLIPAVLSELDEQKINHRNEAVRQKAESLIKRIKEYRRRGSLHEGVVLVRDKVELAVTAAEPAMEASLPWLDPANQDDRMIASLIEVMREHPHSAVTLVTRDINAQNKAELAGLPYTEPPDPASA